MAETKSRIMTLPTLALRGVSVFPATTLHFDVERPMSIAALNAAIGTDRMIFLVAQRDVGCDAPRRKDLYDIGTICRVSQILRTPGGNVKCIVDGLYRARLLRLTAETPCLWANAQVLADEPVNVSSVECAAVVRSCAELFEEYASASGNVTPETLLKAVNRDDPGFVSDFVAQNVYLQPGDKQLLLEDLNPLRRLSALNTMIRRELEIMDIQQDLQSSTAEHMAQSQKEFYLREQMKVIQEELGEGGEGDEIEEYREKILALGLEEEVEKKLLKELNHLAKQPFGSAESSVLRSYLDVCLELPWNVRTEDVTDIARAKKILDEDHYGLTKVKDRILEYLAVRQLSSQVKGGVLCLVGPPGVGKTSIAMSIARATNRKLARISLGGVHDEAEIRGHRKTYVGAMPGRIIAGIQQAGSRNPVLVMDEIDKLGSDYRGDPSAALLEAFDAEQNGTFRDHFLEIPFDLSETLFITTANTADTIPRPLLDRMEVITLGSYTDEEKLQIAKRHLLPKQRAKHGLNGNQLRVTDDAIREIIAGYTRESGVRLLERELASLCRKTARAVAAGERKSLRLRAGEVGAWLGPVRYKQENLFRVNTVGLVHGLAWTSVGGEVLDVECSAVPGSGRLELTGNLGEVMKESCHAAVSYIRSRTASLGIDPEFYKNTDIHLHFPEGAVPKDGPSAGAAICLCVVSALTNRPVRCDVAMTGEITLRGRVLPIGGIQEKSMGALRSGIHEILLPEGNVSDLEEVDENVRNAVTYRAVSHMDQVLEIALCPLPENAEYSGEEISMVMPEQRGREGTRVGV
ncbi:MAG: endopeptidase La [Oscillospiraceae bacterium]|nr:endopeptidase La [Oscillospiraceae bacterium]